MKKIQLLLSIIIISVFLVGCGTGDEETSNNKTEDGQVKLDLWHYWSGHLEEVLQDNVNDFNESQDDIEVSLTFVPYDELTQQLLVGATSGDIPDLVIGGINEVQFYAESGVLENISDQLEGSEFEEQIYENIADIHKKDDEFYGLPLHTNAVALFYNTDLVEEPPTNWDELTEVATSLTEDGVHGFSASAHNSQHGTASWVPFLWSTESDVNDLETPEAIKALDLWKDMYDEGTMPKEVIQKELEEVGVDFYNEKNAMIIGGSWMIPDIEEEAPDLDWSVAQIPKDKVHSSVIGGESIAIGKGQSVEESWEFINFLLEPERQLEWLKATGNYAAFSEVAEDDYFQEDEVRQVFSEVIASSQGYGWGKSHNEINTAVYTAVQEALVGESSSEDALKKASEVIKPLID